MKRLSQLARNERGVAAIETAFALPILVIMLWMFFQLAQMYRAMAGIQQALGEGARHATLCLNPVATGCTAPTPAVIKTKITNSVYGIGPGTFTIDEPVSGVAGPSRYYDLKVNYSQPTNLLLFPGPTMTVSRSKRVWISAT